MERYTPSTYGDAFADIYDEWYGGLDDVEAIADIVTARAWPIEAALARLGG